MAVIETKFDVGSVVWRASTTTEQRHRPCPDCLGSREWTATSPAGAEYKVPCPRCGGGYQSNRDLSLDYVVHAPCAQRLTIGLVKPNGSWDSPPRHQYMAVETGIGSGSLYNEDDLFASEEEALSVAKARADAANLDHEGWAAKQYDRTAKFCDYELRDATIKSADYARIHMGVRVSMLVDDLTEAETIEEVRATIKRWQDRDGEQA
jgi:hypothetical protein